MCCNRVIFSASFVCRPVCANPFGGDVLGTTNFGCFRDTGCGHYHHHGCGCQRRCGCGRRGWF